MGISVPDIRRAILGGGNVSVFQPALRRALDELPVSGASALGAPEMMPGAAALLRLLDAELASLVEAWLEGGSAGLAPATGEVQVVGMAPYGRNTGLYLEKVIELVRPDIVAVDVSPGGLAANMMYSFGMTGAAGLPVYGEVTDAETGQFHSVETLCPGDLAQTVVVKCWRERIPLVPAGMPPVSRRSRPEEALLDREIKKSSLHMAYQAFDAELGKVPLSLDATGLVQQIDQACSSLGGAIGSEVNEKFIDEAGYTASRIADLASFLESRGRKARVLAVVKLEHYDNLRFMTDLLAKGITDEIYQPARHDVLSATMTSRHSAKLAAFASEHGPETTLLQELFRDELQKFSRQQENEEPPPEDVDYLVSTISSRTRSHAGVTRGASVRGTMAFRDVVLGFRALEGRTTLGHIEKAALITLPPRMATRQDDYDSARAVVQDIAREVLYGIRYSAALTPEQLSEMMQQMSPEDIMNSLKSPNSKQSSQGQGQGGDPRGEPTVLPSEEGMHNASGPGRNGLSPDQYSSLKKSIERMMEKLEEMLKRGDITQEEYDREKRRLDDMLDSAAQPRCPMSDQELSETVMELMDAQDRQWQKEISFEQMYIYYHIKAMSEGKELSHPKRDYYGLRVLIDDLEKRGLIRAVAQGRSFTLTAQSLDALLERLVPKPRKGKELDTFHDGDRLQIQERCKYDIRRYTLGDVFRDISVRHTLREIARQRKPLSQVQRRDIKVYMKQPRKLQSDIVLCVDTSSSMGYRHKLTYARLAAAGLARAALENGDRVGIVTFDNFGRTVMPLTDNKEELINYIVAISAGGNTNIGEGIKCASELLMKKPSRNPKFAVLVTDGQPTAITEKAFRTFKPIKEKDLTEEYAVQEVRRAAAKGIKVSVIHIASNGRGADEGFVKNIAKVGNGQVQRIASPEDLRCLTR
ncbi:MAG: VWA domain-containing protein [Chloroflexi bacterium]|nr:VWA domain-containing protein [Chloroflexota bacterium]